jgi:hypothetical protein
VRHIKGERPVQRPIPIGQRLARESKHQVKADVGEPGLPGRCNSSLGLRARVNAVNLAQQSVVKGLHAKRQPVKAGVA